MLCCCRRRRSDGPSSLSLSSSSSSSSCCYSGFGCCCYDTVSNFMTWLSPLWLKLLSPIEFFISIDHSALWLKHVAWAKPDGDKLMQYITARYSTNMVLLSLLLATEINVFFNGANELTNLRSSLLEQQDHPAQSLHFWIGMIMLLDICITLLGLVTTFTLWGMISAISPVNARCLIRSTIGQYVISLPPRLLVASLYLFWTWILLFVIDLVRTPISWIFVGIIGLICISVIIPLSIFGRLVLHTGGMSSKPILQPDLEMQLLPSGLQASLWMRAFRQQQRYNNIAQERDEGEGIMTQYKQQRTSIEQQQQQQQQQHHQHHHQHHHQDQDQQREGEQQEEQVESSTSSSTTSQTLLPKSSVSLSNDQQQQTIDERTIAFNKEIQESQGGVIDDKQSPPGIEEHNNTKQTKKAVFGTTAATTKTSSLPPSLEVDESVGMEAASTKASPSSSLPHHQNLRRPSTRKHHRRLSSNVLPPASILNSCVTRNDLLDLRKAFLLFDDESLLSSAAGGRRLSSSNINNSNGITNHNDSMRSLSLEDAILFAASHDEEENDEGDNDLTGHVNAGADTGVGGDDDNDDDDIPTTDMTPPTTPTRTNTSANRHQETVLSDNSFRGSYNLHRPKQHQRQHRRNQSSARIVNEWIEDQDVRDLYGIAPAAAVLLPPPSPGDNNGDDDNDDLVEEEERNHNTLLPHHYQQSSSPLRFWRNNFSSSSRRLAVSEEEPPPPDSSNHRDQTQAVAGTGFRRRRNDGDEELLLDADLLTLPLLTEDR